jgi:hypothetical protein
MASGDGRTGLGVGSRGSVEPRPGLRGWPGLSWAWMAAAMRSRGRTGMGGGGHGSATTLGRDGCGDAQLQPPWARTVTAIRSRGRTGLGMDSCGASRPQPDWAGRRWLRWHKAAARLEGTTGLSEAGGNGARSHMVARGNSRSGGPGFASRLVVDRGCGAARSRRRTRNCAGVVHGVQVCKWCAVIEAVCVWMV